MLEVKLAAGAAERWNGRQWRRGCQCKGANREGEGETIWEREMYRE